MRRAFRTRRNSRQAGFKDGAANVVIEYDGEADADVTVLFPDDPARRLKIQWKDQKAGRNPGHITIAGRSSWSVAGVAIGTSLIELERLNGGPFKLNYFEGDYGGAITNWLNGRFKARLSGGCVLGAFVGIDERLPETGAKSWTKKSRRIDHCSPVALGYALQSRW